MSELREEAGRDYLDTAPSLVVALLLSSNQPQVQARGRAAEAAQAAVVGLQRHDGSCEVAVALRLVGSGEQVIFASEPMAPASVPGALEHAMQFAESMGFLLDDTGWSRLSEAQREPLFARTNIFHPPREAAASAPAERQKPKDSLAAVARLFAAFALPLFLAASAGCATGMSSEQRGRDAEIHYELGSNMIRTGDAQGALREFMAAVQANPELPQPHAGLGFLYAFSFGRPAEAEEEFRRAIDLDLNYSEAYNNFGAFYLQQHRYAEAVPLFEKALSNPLYPERFIAEGNLGWAYYKMGQVDNGVRRLRAALLLAPKYCKGWRELGTIYSETSKIDDAVEAYGRYASACPEAADALLQHGKVLTRANRAEEARVVFAKCAKTSPDKDAVSVSECSRFLKELGPDPSR